MAINDQLSSIVTEIVEAQNALAKELAEPATDGSRFDISRLIPGSYQSLVGLDSQISTITQSIKGIAEGDITFVPLKILRSALATLSKLQKHYDAARTAASSGRPIRSIDPETFTFTGSDDAQSNLGKELKGASDSTEELLYDWHLLRLAAKSPRINDFASFLKINENNRYQLDAVIADTQRFKAESETAFRTISELEANAKSSQSEIERVTSIMQTDRKTVSEYLAEATTKLEGIRNLTSESASLAEIVSEYGTEFDSFKAQLDERTKRLNDGNAELSNLSARLLEREGIIDRLIKQSEGMLVGATNVGLAGSLSKRFAEISSEVTKARFAYYASVTLLIFATIPIAFDVIPRELLSSILKKISAGYIEIAPSEKVTQADLLGHILARALLLVPALLLVRFAAARHERLFRLREHYAYKYSIASSVEGFKQQSPEQYRDYVALIAFNELTFNPATQMEAKGPETKHLNPILDAALKKMGLAPEQT